MSTPMSVLQQGGSLTSTGKDLNLAIQSMVLCRALLTYLGYPIDLDGEFRDVDHISVLGDICATAAQEGVLWDFNPHDVSTIVAPVLDYAIYLKNFKDLTATGKQTNVFYMITPTGLHYKQDIMTMEDAWNVSKQLDALLHQKGVAPIYGKWIRFIRFVSEICPDAVKEIWTPEFRSKANRRLHYPKALLQRANRNLMYTCVTANQKIPFGMSFMRSVRSANSTLCKRMKTHSGRLENEKAHGAESEKEVAQGNNKSHRRTSSLATVVSNSSREQFCTLPGAQTSFTSNGDRDDYILTPEARKRLHEELIRGSVPVNPINLVKFPTPTYSIW